MTTYTRHTYNYTYIHAHIYCIHNYTHTHPTPSQPPNPSDVYGPAKAHPSNLAARYTPTYQGPNVSAVPNRPPPHISRTTHHAPRTTYTSKSPDTHARFHFPGPRAQLHKCQRACSTWMRGVIAETGGAPTGRHIQRLGRVEQGGVEVWTVGGESVEQR